MTFRQTPDEPDYRGHTRRQKKWGIKAGMVIAGLMVLTLLVQGMCSVATCMRGDVPEPAAIEQPAE